MTSILPAGNGLSIDFEQDQDTLKIHLPCTRDEFAEFMTGLLGKPQSLSKVFNQQYDVRIEDLMSIHYAIVQRLQEQNDAHIVQFRATLGYDDLSKIVINSIDDFKTYNEIRNVCSQALLL